MSRRTDTLPPDYFLGLYADDLDPWRFATSEYERDKYAATLAALPRERYGHAFEIGCSIGVFTRQLARRCDRLTALDVVPAAVDAARERCADQPWVTLACGSVPADWPPGRFDLVVIAEVLYFFAAADVRTLAERAGASLAPGGEICLVHWLGLTDYPLSGDEAAETFIAAAEGFARPVRADRTDDYRLDLLRAG